MPLLLPLAIFALLGFFVLLFFINFRTLMSIMAGIIFFVALVALPPLLAGGDEGLQLLVFFGILVIVFMTVGKDIIHDRRLNFFMGAALLLGLMFNFSYFCRRG